MNRWNNVPFNPLAVPPAAVPANKPQPRVPQQFIDAMKRLTSDMSAQTPPAHQTEALSSAVKWRYSFKPLGDKEGNFKDKGTGSSERTTLYDPYSPLTSDSEADLPKAQDRNHSPSSQDNTLGRQHLSPVRGCHDSGRWDSPLPKPVSRPLGQLEFTAGMRPTENRGTDSEPVDHPGYGSMSGPRDQRGSSPDRLPHSSSNQRFPPSYGGQKTNGEERIAVPDYRREMTTTVRLSPPRLQRDYQHQLPYVDKGLDRDPPPTNMTRNRNQFVVMERSTITCDLCDVVLANGQELNDHLDSKSHWDTLEHIQERNNYDDMAIAFLQDVMLYKSHQCSRAIEDSALQALQENDHMTKVEMFHCAACKVFVSTSAAEVQAHITSQEHLSNTKEFEVQQRHSCLSKAKSMMKELQPQFEHFLKGGSPFE